MNEFEAAYVLSAYPAGTKIVSARSYNPNYKPYPMKVSVQTVDGNTQACVLKRDDRIEILQRQTSLLKVLTELGLLVPAVLAGPVALPNKSQIGGYLLMSELRGDPLPWLGLNSLAEADLTCRLVQQGVLGLHQLTERIARHEIAAELPRVTLLSELEGIIKRGGKWFEVELFARAVDLLQSMLPEIDTPLVFSNGDYNPLNFLYVGNALTGWIDFEGACFEDPLIGFAKFQLFAEDDYGWGAGMKAGLIERFLYNQNLTRNDFAPRLILRCLRHLQEVPVGGDADYMLKVLKEVVSDQW